MKILLSPALISAFNYFAPLLKSRADKEVDPDHSQKLNTLGTSKYKFTKLSIALLAILTFSLTCFAQSGRAIETQPAQAVDGAGESQLCEKDSAQIVYIAPRKIKDFVKEVNRLGACGYRIEAVGKLNLGVGENFTNMNIFAVVKMNASDFYEYQWFEALNGGEAVTRSNSRAKDGFYFHKSLPFRASRNLTDEENQEKNATLSTISNLRAFPTGAMYFFERKNKIIRKREYQMINGADDRGEKALARNQKNLDEKIAQGFRPVGVFYTGYFDVHQVLIEKDENIKPTGEYVLLRYTFNSGKVFTKYAQQGYRLSMVGLDFALFRREQKEPLPVKYETADNFYDMRKKIPKLENARYEGKGLDYRTEYELMETKPYFIVPTENGGKMYETKFIEMTNFYERYFERKDKTANYTDAPSAEMLAEFQKAIGEGYTIRDVYSHPEITVVLEREKPSQTRINTSR